MNSNLAMIPKKQFVKLRKYVLDYLKRNSDANGNCHLQHGSLDTVIMYARSMEFHPFSGMSRESREAATDRFWEALVNAKHVEVISAPVTLTGQEGKHYFLPGTKPFHDSTLRLFGEVRRENA